MTSMVLDYLASQNNGNTLVFGVGCPNSLIKEAILRGFQVNSEHYDYDKGRKVTSGGGFGEGFGGGGTYKTMLLEYSFTEGYGEFPGTSSGAGSSFWSIGFGSERLLSLSDYNLKTLKNGYYLS